jgi:hypothetical protein
MLEYNTYVPVSVTQIIPREYIGACGSRSSTTDLDYHKYNAFHRDDSFAAFKNLDKASKISHEKGEPGYKSIREASANEGSNIRSGRRVD